jgi:hypothetical protein
MSEFPRLRSFGGRNVIQTSAGAVSPEQADGPSLLLDIGSALPALDGVAVQADSLLSAPGGWKLYLRARPAWFRYSEDRRRKWCPVAVHAEDDRGGAYRSAFGGSTGRSGHEEVVLKFLPLDPLARGLKLTFRAAGEEVPVSFGLPS